MKLTSCSFIGVDTKTDFNKVLALSQDLTAKYPFECEFGILYSESKNGKHNRYPDKSFTEDFAKMDGILMRTIHLCGTSVKKFLEGDEYLDQLCLNFSRVQLNFSMKQYSIDWLLEHINARGEDGHVMIVQSNKSKKEFIEQIIRQEIDVDILFDGSGGFGRVLETPPAPIQHLYCGYAGGIGPDTVEPIMNSILQLPYDCNFYIDMESAVRTDNWLDLNKCKIVADICNNMVGNINK